MRLRKTLHNQTRYIAQALVVLCMIPALAVGVLAVYTQSLTAMALSVVMAPTLLFAWRIYRTADSLRIHAHDQAEMAAGAENHYFGVLSQVMAVVEGRDPYLAGRSERIGRLTAQMGAALGLDSGRVQLLGKVARVHDIGLLAVPPEILRKATSLSGEEYGTVKKHCQVGCHMLQPLSFLVPVLDAVLYHHERMNGTGYPDGLTGESIPLEARILAVADSFDAMTHDRPHRGPLTNRQAVGELVRCADVGYDRHCVIALAKIVGMADVLPAVWADEPVEVAVAAPAPQRCPVLVDD